MITAWPPSQVWEAFDTDHGAAALGALQQFKRPALLAAAAAGGLGAGVRDAGFEDNALRRVADKKTAYDAGGWS